MWWQRSFSLSTSGDLGGVGKRMCSNYRPFLSMQILLLLVLFRMVPGGNLYNERHLSDESAPTIDDKSKGIPSFDERKILDLEKMLAMQEMKQTTKALEEMKNQGYSIYGFYHSSTWQEYWREVVSEQLYLLDGWRKFPSTHTVEIDKMKGNVKLDYSTYEWDTSRKYTSLLNITEQLYMNVAGHDIKDFHSMKALVSYLMLENRYKIYMNFNMTLPREAYDDAPLEQKTMYDQMHNISSGEYPTVMKLYETCRSLSSQGKKALVYYIHSKGSCCWKDVPQVYHKEKMSSNYSDIHSENVDFSPVSTWRQYLNAMILEFPSICLRAIMEKNYSTCGVENQLAHYSGNFWWADCDHIAKLDPLRNRFDWRKPEFWVMFAHGSGSNNGLNKRFAHRCGYAIFSCNLNLYQHECPRFKYRETLWNDAFSEEVGRSTPRGAAPTDEASVCKELRSSNVTSYNELIDSLNKLFSV